MPATKSTVEIRDFPGLVTNMDSMDLDPGAAQKQVNAQSAKVGELQVRPGLREVSFEAED